MQPAELKAIVYFLRERVQLGSPEVASPDSITFSPPSLKEMEDAGLHPEGSSRLLKMPWWDEMLTDVTETPELCEAGEDPQLVLKFSRDVISEYIAKQFPLNPE